MDTPGLLLVGQLGEEPLDVRLVLLPHTNVPLCIRLVLEGTEFYRLRSTLLACGVWLMNGT